MTGLMPIAAMMRPASGAAQIEVVGTGNISPMIRGTDTAVPWPAGAQDGDIGIMLVGDDGQIRGSITFTDVVNANVYDVGAGNPGTHVQVLAYDAAATPEVRTNTNNESCVVLICFRNVAGTVAGTVPSQATVDAIASQCSGSLEMRQDSNTELLLPVNTNAMSGNAMEIQCAVMDDKNIPSNTSLTQEPFTGKTPAAETTISATASGGDGSNCHMTCRYRTDSQALNANTGGVDEGQPWTWTNGDATRSLSFSLEGHS